MKEKTVTAIRVTVGDLEAQAADLREEMKTDLNAKLTKAELAELARLNPRLAALKAARVAASAARLAAEAAENGDDEDAFGDDYDDLEPPKDEL